MRFIKMHGLGNDYIFFNCIKRELRDPEAVSRRLSDRHFSIGGDGIVLILPSKTADFRMRMFNADGSEGKMCGNASRCIGKYVYEAGLTDKTTITLETLSGIRTLRLSVAESKVQTVTVDMGKADFRTAAVPMLWEQEEVIQQPFSARGKDWRITCLSVGNPHCVIFCDDPADIALEQYGPLFENAEVFPERTNVEFVRCINENTLEMRVWERGSGETLACGTGACASAAAAVRCGFCSSGEPIRVILRGGELKITVFSDGNLQMEGTAEYVFSGEIDDVQYE